MSLPRFSVHNEVLVNVLMLVILVGGVMFATTLTREMFPESQPDKIIVSVIYPGVQPEEIEKAITIKIEEAVRDVDGVEKIDSTISEGGTVTLLTLRNEVEDADSVLQEIKAEVDAIQDLPDEIEAITVRKLLPKLPVIGIALYGEADEAALKQSARNLRDDLLRLPGITEVEMGGVRDDEISVEVRPERLREFDVTFAEVAEAIRSTNLDISGGQLKGNRSNIAVRTLGEETRGIDLENLVLRSRPDGTQIRLADVATIRDQFIDSDAESYFNGQRAVNILVYKIGNQDVLQISQTVKAYIRGKQHLDEDFTGWTAAAAHPWYWRPFALIGNGLLRLVIKVSGQPDPQQVYLDSYRTPFAHNYDVALHTDLARYLEGRLDLMMRNGSQGLMLVIISLLLFLDWRLALWTAFGILTSFLGSFIVMWLLGVSLNLISIFGLIIVLGIVVDDAIVIGENIYRHIQEGMPPTRAAIVGAEEVMWPVIASVSTTIGAFTPLLFMKGQIGDFFSQLPLVIISALSVSLVEAIIILPAHLKHLPPRERLQARETAAAFGLRAKWNRWSARVIETFSHSTAVSLYEQLLALALRWRYVTIAISIMCLLLTFGIWMGGVVKTEFIQKMDSESIIADLEMPIGTPADQTRERLIALTTAARELPEIVNVQMHVAVRFSVGPAGADSVSAASHLGQLIIELKAADLREQNHERTSEQILVELRQVSDKLAGVNSVTWTALSGGPAGKDVEVVVNGPRFDDIVAVAQALKQKLASFSGTVDIDDDFDRGKREVQLTLYETARPTGVTVGQLGEFVRSAMYGREARRITRNREDVKIMVRYPESYRSSVYDLESMWVPIGPPNQRGWAPLSALASLQETESYGTLHRSHQMRCVRVLADVLEGADGEVIRQGLKSYFDTDLQGLYPDVELRFQGVAEDQAKSMDSLRLAMPLALLIIYAIVASVFRSYYQPVVVMLAIPFGLMGATLGHWVTGYPMTIISGIGFVALTGIVVNDAIVLINYVNVRIREGIDPFEANLEGSKTRLRAIFLTSETTIAGMLPMLFETSFQAKFLIPMAITISFGLLFSTVQTLIIAPSLNMIFTDVITWLGLPVVPEEDRIEPSSDSRFNDQKTPTMMA
ncbi:MMPL family transporter [bacterium]|nr:MMPL family transporter [bacterium]